MVKRKLQFPKKIFVNVEYDKEDAILIASKDAETAVSDLGELDVAIYEFVRMAKIKTKVEVI